MRSRNTEGKSPIMKMRMMSGVRTNTSRAFMSGRRRFFGFDSGPKNIFCVTLSMYTAPRITPNAASVVSMPLNLPSRGET
jgi:hypothetical protein